MKRKEEIEMQAEMDAKANRLAYPELAVKQGFIRGATWSDENPDGKMLLHVLEKGVKQGKREMLDKVCDFIADKLKCSVTFDEYGTGVMNQSLWESKEYNTISEFIEGLRKVMED
jgi:hypothetical protein